MFRPCRVIIRPSLWTN